MYKTTLFFSALALATIGCTSHASHRMTAACDRAPHAEENVDVFLDEKPKRPFREVAELRASTVENPRSIASMREEAARLGLDGIYWIDCVGSTSSRCTAKGFVYEETASSERGGSAMR